MKTCSKCKQTKELSEFNKHKRQPDGFYPRCRICKREDDRIYYSKTKDIQCALAKEYYLRKRDTILEKRKQSHIVKQYQQEYRQKHREQHLEYMQEYHRTHRKEKQEYKRERKANDPLYRLAENLRSRISKIIRKKKFYKTGKFREALGCTNEQLFIHLSALFQPGMTWENYGEWEVDHIIPVSKADTGEEVYTLNHYLNLQPLWAPDNNAKGGYKRSK